MNKRDVWFWIFVVVEILTIGNILNGILGDRSTGFYEVLIIALVVAIVGIEYLIYSKK